MLEQSFKTTQNVLSKTVEREITFNCSATFDPRANAEMLWLSQKIHGYDNSRMINSADFLDIAVSIGLTARPHEHDKKR